MAIEIDLNKCIACKKCTKVCPGNLLYIENNKAKSYENNSCWDCAACIKECPVKAISMYLQTEIGGNGTKLRAEYREEDVLWEIETIDGEIEKIIVEKSKSFEY